MIFSQLFSLVISASLATASVVGQRHPNPPVKRGEGTVVGAEEGTSYHWKTASTSQQCPTLLSTDLQTSLVKFDPLFPPQYDATSSDQTSCFVGALYLGYSTGTYAFALQYTGVTPNTTATWIDTGADIANVWAAVRGDIVDMWSHNTTFQWVWYNVTKTMDGVSKYAGQFQIQIQTPTFVKGCDTSCGGDCDPNICTC